MPAHTVTFIEALPAGCLTLAATKVRYRCAQLKAHLAGIKPQPQPQGNSQPRQGRQDRWMSSEVQRIVLQEPHTPVAMFSPSSPSNLAFP